MYRYLKYFILALLGMLSLATEASTVEFTYAEGELFGYGQGMRENIDVAICIDNPALKGMKIKGFRAYLSGTEGYENTSLWLTRELTLENKVNVPDIATYTVSPQAAPYGDGEIGMLSIDLPEPYELTGEPVYLGYSLTVSDNSTPEQKYPIVVSEGYNPNGFYLHMSKSVLKWMDYSKKAQGVAYIVAVLEGDISEYALSISGYKEANVMPDTDYNVELTVNNIGFRNVTDLKYSYTYDDEDEVMEGAVTLQAPIVADVAVSWPLTLNFKGIGEAGPHILKLRIDEVNGHPNASTADYMECLVNVMPYAPVHRPLVEEFTGLWCGWCPRGWVGMELLGDKFGQDVVIVCYHNGDPMAVTNTYPVAFSGYPNASINRAATMDPYYGTYSENYDFGIAYNVENSMAEMTIADINVEARLEGSKVIASSTTTFMKDIPDANYQVGYVLNCNGLQNIDWKQSNYYTGMTEEYAGTHLEELTRMPKLIPLLTFNDVAIDVSATEGVDGSLPTVIKTGQEYTHSHTFDIAGNGLVAATDKLVVNAFVIDKNTGTILNANKFALAGATGTGSLTDTVEAVSVKYYDLNGTEVKMPCKGIVIKREIMSDGTQRTSKIIL